MSDNAKLGRVIKAILAPGGDNRKNTDIAKEVGCDEGMVRRGRQVALVESLRTRIAELEAENADLRAAKPAAPNKPRRRRDKTTGHVFWEDADGNPKIPMLQCP